jgi:hypothetical protein
MRINDKQPQIAALVARWNSTNSSNDDWKERKSEDLRRELALKVIEPELKAVDRQLILHHNRFLTMKPNGVHSFAHGSEMVSDTVDWISVGRISGSELKRVNASSRMIGRGEAAFRIGFAAQFHVPLRSAYVSLAPRYAMGAHQPHFVIREEKPEEAGKPQRFSLDVSALGDHLFRLKRGQHDWYTQIEIVLGTEDVRAWLVEHKSEDAYLELERHL